MRITALAVPQCPNAPLALQRGTVATAGRPARGELVEAPHPGQAAAQGMTTSPTVLINGTDPFAAHGAPPSVSCRPYRDADGTVHGAPSEEVVRRALDRADPSAAGAGSTPRP